MVGQSIGNFKILEKLSEGGMGAVYKALDTMLDREVAIKVLRPHLSTKNIVIERFHLEAVALAKLNHPNIATLHSFFSQDDQLFMILEFVRGETLDKVLHRRGPLSCDEVIPIFSQVLDGVNHVHEYGIVHRDLKPANIMLTEKGTLKVLDFGIARLLGSARITRTGNIIGTLEYMSPEQVRGEETDARSDIYTLGMTLYEILTGDTPFDIENEFELIQKQIGEMPPRPRTINPDIPEEIEAIIIKAYAKNPDRRFQTAGEFREALLNACFATSDAALNGIESFSKEFVTHPSESGIPQPFISKITVREMHLDLSEKSSEEIETETMEVDVGKLLAANGINPHEFEDDVIEIPLNQIPTPADAPPETDAKSRFKPSFLSKLVGGYHAGTGAAIAGIFALLFLLAALPFIFYEAKENPLNNENKESIEIKPDAEEQKPDVLPLVTPLPSPVRAAPPNGAGQTMATKKKAAREAEAERLRRAERILTGN